jgi:transposase
VDTLPVTARADLTDAQWAVLEPLLPKGRKSGRPRKWSRRQLIDGIRWRGRVGSPWRDVPSRYGPWQTVYGLFRRWQRDGTWARVLTGLQGVGGCGRVDYLGCQCGLHYRPGTPARGRGAEKDGM